MSLGAIGDGRKARGKSTIFNTILQLQRLPRLITYWERNILQLVLLVRYMFARITIRTSNQHHSTLCRIPAKALPTNQGPGRRGKKYSHAPIQATDRNLRAIMITRQWHGTVLLTLYTSYANRCDREYRRPKAPPSSRRHDYVCVRSSNLRQR